MRKYLAKIVEKHDNEKVVSIFGKNEYAFYGNEQNAIKGETPINDHLEKAIIKFGFDSEEEARSAWCYTLDNPETWETEGESWTVIEKAIIAVEF